MIQKAYIEPTIEQTLRNKYLSLLQQAAYVPKWLVEKQQADNNAIALPLAACRSSPTWGFHLYPIQARAGSFGADCVRVSCLFFDVLRLFHARSKAEEVRPGCRKNQTRCQGCS